MDNLEIGNIIRKKRIEKGFTQEQLAEKLNVSTKTISRWENGQSAPEISSLKKVCDELGVGVSYLLGEENSNNDHKINHSSLRVDNIAGLILIFNSVVLIDLLYGFLKTFIFWVANNKTIKVYGFIYSLLFTDEVMINYQGVKISDMLLIFIGDLFFELTIIIVHVVHLKNIHK